MKNYTLKYSARVLLFSKIVIFKSYSFYNDVSKLKACMVNTSYFGMQFYHLQMSCYKILKVTVGNLFVS